MRRFIKARYLLAVALLVILFTGIGGGVAVLAADDEADTPAPAQEEPAGESLEVYSRFPVLQNQFGTMFEYEVTLYYEGDDARTFDLDMELPDGWQGIFVGGYPETEISAFTVEPGKAREAITLRVSPTQAALAGPGEYTFTVRAASGDLEGSLDLEAIVVPQPPQYLLYLYTATLTTEFSVRPGDTNHLSLQLQNYASGTVENIQLAADVPEGWEVTFTPSSIGTLEYGVTQEIDMVLVPPDDAEAGDYPVLITVNGDQTKTERALRLTVVRSENWGVGGVIAVVAAVVVLAVWFRKAGTR